MVIERFAELPRNFEKIIHDLSKEDRDLWNEEEYEKGRAVLATVLNRFYQKTVAGPLSDDAKKQAFREILQGLEEDERELLLQALEREV